MKNEMWPGVAGVMVAALVLTAMPAVVGAEGKPPGACPVSGMNMRGNKDMKKHMQEMDKKLGLTDEQAAKMKALREENRAAMESIRAELKTKQESLRQVLDADKPDRGKAEAIVNEINALEKKMAMGRVDEVLGMRGVLTPEQYKKLCELRIQKKSGMKGRHKDHPGAHKGSAK